MPEAIFLSASVPDPRRAPEFARTADSVAIASAVTALVHVVLGRRLLVWGGHPAITPMIRIAAETMGIDYGSWVKLYQSNFFQDEFPDDNKRFRNVTYTEDINHDLGQSLREMRERMFKDHAFEAAVFVGGMAGIVDEFEMVRGMQPDARLVPVISTGGATLALKDRLDELPTDLSDNLDYVALFHRHLDIPVLEQRYATPELQPERREERMAKVSAATSAKEEAAQVEQNRPDEELGA